MVINYSRKKTDGNEIKQLTELENETFDLVNLTVVEAREQEMFLRTTLIHVPIPLILLLRK